jgi:hypothetical protein
MTAPRNPPRAGDAGRGVGLRGLRLLRLLRLGIAALMVPALEVAHEIDQSFHSDKRHGVV